MVRIGILSLVISLISWNVLDASRVSNCYSSDDLSLLDRSRLSVYMIDWEKKIFMGWTPKAACTNAVAMFFDNMGFESGINYTTFPHVFRKHYQDKTRSVNSNLCILTDPFWHRFKVVRNPFDRAVSSFLHIMSTKLSTSVYHTERAAQQATFRSHLDLMEKSGGIIIGAGHHDVTQALDLEMNQFLSPVTPPLFRHIVKVENIERELSRVNNDFGSNFNPNYFLSNAYRRPISEEVKVIRKCKGPFLGNIEWRNLSHIPHEKLPYECFYDHSLKEQASRLFAKDILLYNYSFPYILPTDWA